ncbi:MAG: BatA domain-containing protein, partial [Fimbriimonadaceae bacterium]|nr:BatA domain-containing protein [Alphaproteobacteria bacterium]
MTSLFANIGLGAPFILWALILLPVIWWLLRLTPPRLQRMIFPPIRLLLGLKTREDTPAHSPWWLTALRMLLAAIVILALAEPILYPRTDRALADGPLVLIVDNSWGAAEDWQTRRDVMREEIARAQRTGRSVILAPTAPSNHPQGLLRESAGDALTRVDSILPMPHAPDHMALLARLEPILKNVPHANIVWLADGLGFLESSRFAAALKNLTPDTALQVYRPNPGAGPLALTAPSHGDNGLEIEIMRADNGIERRGTIVARALNGRVLGETQFDMLAGERIVTANLDMPLELRNEVSRVEIAGVNSSGAVHLLDERWKKKRVGLIAGDSSSVGQPLLSPLFYVERALSPFAELMQTNSATLPEGIGELIDARVGAMILTDVGTIAEPARIALNDWINKGGVLIRFAGPSLSSANTELVPVRLRDGARALGGTLSWSSPQGLAEFADHGAFKSIQVPSDVTVSRQVLAEPDIALSTR